MNNRDMPQDATKQREDLKKQLQKLRDVPVNTDGVQDDMLLPITNYLLDLKPAKDGVLHWFCSDADDVGREAALFLLRLFAYKNDLVTAWRTQMLKSLHGCAACIQSLDEAKTAVRSTYFGAFLSDVMKKFWLVFEEWEVEELVNAMKSAGISQQSTRSLKKLPPPVFYHLLSKGAAFKELYVLDILAIHPLPSPISNMPLRPLPPGCLLLLLHESAEIRSWVKTHFDVNEEIRIIEQHDLVARAISERIARGSSSSKKSDPAVSIANAFPFISSQEQFWKELESVIRILPPNLMHSSGIAKALIGHLHDTESHFSEVLRRTFQLVRRLGKGMWENEDSEFPQVVFDSIKDNPSFMKMVLIIDPASKERPWFLAGFLDLLASLWEVPSFGEILARLIAFMCGELQHERFKNVRPVVMSSAAQILTAVVRRVSKSKSESQSKAIANILDVRSRVIVAVACSREYSKPEWETARKQTQTLLHDILASDVDAIASAILKLSNMSSTTVDASEIAAFLQPIRTQMWQSVYAEMDSSDAESICLLIGLSGRSAKLDQLHKRAYFQKCWKAFKALGNDAYGKPKEPPKDIQETLDSVMDAVDSSLSTIREGFLTAIERFSNSKTQREIKDFLKMPNVILHVMALLLSPVDDLHAAAQTLIGQAFDIEDRADCFRRLFDMAPEASFAGIRVYIEKFNIYALQITEACSVSKALVRCMTDVIEVLGNSPDGLLKNERYIEKSKTDSFSIKEEIPKFWKNMTTSISVIFKRTSSWSVYFDNQVMAEWMRDALIFGRDLLARRRAFEGAALYATGQGSFNSSPRKLSSIGKRMVDDLQGVFYELHSWLRLVDEELLYQSFALLKSLMGCFRDLGVRPADAVLTKMRRFVDLSRDNKAMKISILDPSCLAELDVFVSSFDEGEDDVVLLSDDVGRKLFESRKPDTTSTDTKKAVVEVKKAGPSKPKESAIHAPKRRLSQRDSSPEIEEVIMTSKPQKSFINFGKIQRVAPSVPSKNRHEPKFEGRIEQRKLLPPPSSAGSDESDSDEEKIGLADLAKLQDSPLKKVKPKKVEERRQIKIIDDPMLTGRNPIRQRLDRREAALRNALRLKPDIAPLHRIILSWNYEHDGDVPPFSDAKPILLRVPDRFKDHAEYMKVFEPLIMYECWAQIIKSKEETSPEIFPAKIVARSFVDDWLDLDMEFTEAIRKDWRLAETDVVLLRNIETQKCVMGKCVGFRKSMTGVQVSLRTHSGKLGDPGLSVGSIWRLNLVFSLSTIHREFAALMGLPYYDLANVIFSPRLADPPSLSALEVGSAMKSYQVNEPQAHAILSAMRTDGFSLIQGPPGTGKTWTICGLVGAFLSSRRSAATTVSAGKQPGTQNKAPKQKVLVCAPSNAAIDEVAKRIKDGVYGSSGSRLVPKVVRVGAEASINISVKDVSLDALVDAKLSSVGANSSQPSAGAEVAKLRVEIQAVKTLKEEKQQEMASIHDNVAKGQALDREIKDLNTKRMNLLHKLDRLRDQEKSQNRTLDAVRRKARQDVLDDADVICSTLSGAGHEVLDQYDFSMVIIDEAAQSIEISSLIPLKYRCAKCILVGDPQQLPPTVLSMEASKWGYNQSLFLRLQRQRPSAVHLLSIQYRMHPDISVLPSRVFYDGRLKDGPDMAEKTSQPWHSDTKFGVYKFFNASRGREESSRIGHSLMNKEETRIILALFDRLLRQFPDVNFDYRIGVVSMYRAQVADLRGAFRKRYGEEILSKVDFNTVDGFQGQEKDIIILSCVRAGPSLSSVGFLSDVRRMNVAMTRSRSSLFIIGNSATLERSDETWKKIVVDARSRSCLVDLPDLTYFNAPANPVLVNTRPQDQQPVSPNTSTLEKSQDEPLFTPKQMKSIQTPRSARQTSNVTANIEQETSKSAKRKIEDDHAQRPAPADRPNAPPLTASSSRPNPALLPSKPIATNTLDDETKKRRAEKDLRALEKRKKKAGNNPFIK